MRLPRNRVPELLLLLLLLFQAGLNVHYDRMRKSMPPMTHHSTFLAVTNMARMLQGWTPVSNGCLVTDCRDGWATLPAPEQRPPASERWGRLLDDGASYFDAFPYNALPAALLVMLFPGSASVAILGPCIWFAFLLTGIFQLGKLAQGPWTGLLAATIAGGLPGLFAFAQVHQDPVPIAAISVWYAVAVLASDGFLRLGWCLLAAALVYLGHRTPECFSGELNALLVMCAPTLSGLFTILRKRKEGLRALFRRLLGLAFVGGTFMVITRSNMEETDSLSYIKGGVAAEEPFLFLDAQSWFQVPQLAYVEDMLRHQVGIPLTLFLVAGVVLLIRTPARYKLTILGMHLVPLVLLSLLSRKAVWYLPPALPGLVLAGTLGWTSFPRPMLGSVAVGLSVFCALYLRLSMMLAPGLFLDTAKSLLSASPRGLALMELAVPTSVVAGDAFMQAPQVKPASAAKALGAYIRDIEGRGPAVRLLLLSSSWDYSLSACWVIHLEATNSACYAPFAGAPSRTARLDPNDYDLVAWIEPEGLMALPENKGAPLPEPIERVLAEQIPEFRPQLRTMVEQTLAIPWQRVDLDEGPVWMHPRLDVASTPLRARP